MTEADFRDAFHANKAVLYRFAYRMTGSGSVAEDIVQDCFVALWEKPGAYDARRGTMRTFLLGIARNLILKRWRRERPHEPLDDESLVCLPIDLEGNQRREMVAKTVLQLPPLQREAVILAEYEEMALQEIADATGVELAAAKSRLHRGRQNLRRMLAHLMESKGSLYETK